MTSIKTPIKTRVATAVTMTVLLGGGVIATSGPAAAQINQYCSYTSSQPTLREGSSGTSVKQAQCEIDTTLRTTNIAIDGSFGPATLAAVKKVQSCAHIAVDGVIGPNTWSVLNYWSKSTGWLC